jgi:hypothetical protein
MNFRMMISGLFCGMASLVLLAESLPLMITSSREVEKFTLDDKATLLQSRVIKRTVGKSTNTWLEVSLHVAGENSTNAVRTSLVIPEVQRVINGLEGSKSALLQKYPANEEVVVTFQEGDFHPSLSFKNGALTEVALTMGNKKLNITTNDITGLGQFFKRGLAEAKQ